MAFSAVSSRKDKNWIVAVYEAAVPGNTQKNYKIRLGSIYKCSFIIISTEVLGESFVTACFSISKT